MPNGKFRLKHDSPGQRNNFCGNSIQFPNLSEGLRVSPCTFQLLTSKSAKSDLFHCKTYQLKNWAQLAEKFSFCSFSYLLVLAHTPQGRLAPLVLRRDVVWAMVVVLWGGIGDLFRLPVHRQQCSYPVLWHRCHPDIVGEVSGTDCLLRHDCKIERTQGWDLSTSVPKNIFSS